MRELIGERPNIIPSGLGNGTSGMDMSDFMIIGTVPDDIEEKDVEDPDSPNRTRWGMEESENEDGKESGGEEGGRGEGSEEVTAKQGKRNNNSKVKVAINDNLAIGRTSAKPGNSRPAERPTKEKTKRKADDFAGIAEAEEVTKQTQLDVQRVKFETKKAKLSMEETKIAYKMEKLKHREARRQEKKEERAIKLRIFHQREQQGMGGMHPVTPRSSSGAPGNMMSTSYYRTGASTPSTGNDLADEFSFVNDIPLPGPSTSTSNMNMFSAYSSPEGTFSGRGSEFGDLSGTPSSSSLHG